VGGIKKMTMKQAAQAVIDAYDDCDSPEALQIAIDNLRELLTTL
jgi:hypothetical protein